jgi:hypothetical protein
MAEQREATSKTVDRAQIAYRTLRCLVPVGYRPTSYRRRLQSIASSGRVLPSQRKAIESMISAIDAAMQATTIQVGASQ